MRLVRVLTIAAAAISASAVQAQECSPEQVFNGCSEDWLQSSCGEGCDGCEGLFSCGPESPVNFRMSVAGNYQGVVDGGVDQAWQFGGSGSYDMNIDFGKMGLKEGLGLRIMAEHRFGDFIAREAGVILPPGLDAVTPAADSENLILTNVMFSQVINEKITFIFGKMDTLNGDSNPFASGRGRTGFMNVSMLLPINGVPIVPFATLGAGAIFSVDGNPAASLLVLNGTDTTKTSGFDELFDEGACIVGAVNLPFSLNDKTGIQTLSFAYNTREFNALGQDPRVILPNVPINQTQGGWVAWWSGTQFIQQFDPKNNPMLGWGMFGRFGVADTSVAPVTYWANFGFGGNSPIACRHQDRWGIGWFYGGFSDELGPLATTALNVGDSTTGIELFYNFAVNDHIFITPDIQVIEPGRNGVDTALVIGLRGEITL